RFIGAPGRSSIALYKNTTEAINAVMYSLLTEFRDGDNVVTTTMEHNSNYVPWYAMCREILPRLGRRVQYRLAVRPGHRRTGPRAPGVAGRRAHQAGLLHWRVQLPRHAQPAGRGQGAGRRERLLPAERRAPFLPAGRRRPAGAGVVRRRAGA